MRIRDAVATDAPEISTFLKELTAAGKRKSPDDVGFVLAHYIESTQKIKCSVAEDQGVVLGFQSLQHAAADTTSGNGSGWAVIGTHIRPSAARRGVGRALFAASQSAAESADVTDIEATIAADNPEALAYYDAMGFKTYKTTENQVCKRFSAP